MSIYPLGYAGDPRVLREQVRVRRISTRARGGIVLGISIIISSLLIPHFCRDLTSLAYDSNAAYIYRVGSPTREQLTPRPLW